MGDSEAMGLDELPNHLLHRILQVGDLEAVDLAMLEMSCYTFRAAGGIEPYRFKSMTENAALLYCQSDPLFVRLPPTLQAQLINRCRGNRKLVMRFLQATHQAANGVCTPHGQVQVVAGKYLTFLIKGEGKLFGCGSNQFGILGQGPLMVECRAPVKVPVPSGCRVKQISGTHHHVAFVTENGEVFTYGDNSSGCCGHGDIEGPIYTPTLVESLSGIPCKQVSTGLSFTAAVTTEGVIYTWGSGSHGQLGHGDTVEQSQPLQIESLSSIGVVTQVATGASYTLALMDNGDLYSFGYGANYCLGHDDSASEWQPRRVALDENCFFTSVAAADEHSVAIDSQGQVYTWGKGYCGPLGHGVEDDVREPKVVEVLRNILAVQVSAQRRKTFVLADTGQIFAFGWIGVESLGLPSQSVLGLPTNSKALIPMHIAFEGPFAKQNIGQVSAGFYHTASISREGLFLSIGDDEKGQLGFDIDFPKWPFLQSSALQ
ncbi:unnamed protein product [Calypogeia fissa]